MLSLSTIPCLLFLLAASRQDAREHRVSRLTLLVWFGVGLAGWLAGAWAWSLPGMAVGLGCAWLAGLPRGDRYGAAVVGGYLGAATGYAVGVALVLVLVQWLRWGPERSPADFAFFPFLLVGVILFATIYMML